MEMIELLSHNTFFSENSRKGDIETIRSLIQLANGVSIKQKTKITDRIKLVRENYKYIQSQIDLGQSVYLDLLNQKLETESQVSRKRNESNFSLRDILELVKEFLDWLPNKEIARSLKEFYCMYFSDHVYFCQKTDLILERGLIYSLNCFRIPFVIVKKDTFIETFITIIHELGHVISELLDLNVDHGKAGNLFIELDGRYFELLAISFLLEKQQYKKDAMTSLINSYYEIKSCVNSTRFPGVLETFFTCEQVEENLCEIYSYLGSLELLYRYHGDYEKQLYDFRILLEMYEDDMQQYLQNAEFSWRNDGFKTLQKHKNWIHDHREF